MASRVKIGDVIQILTSEGVAYGQITHKHREYGFLLRVFPGFYDKKQIELSNVVSSKPLFSVFFPIQAAVSEGLVSVVGNVSVSDFIKEFPTFRVRNGQKGSCWLWNGVTSIRLDREFSEDELMFPVKEIISAPLLLKRIEIGYRAETHAK